MANVSLIPEIVLYDIVGLPAAAGPILFVPALFDFRAESEGAVEYHLSDFEPDLPRLYALFNCFDLSDELVLQYWVRARIPCAFSLRPPVGGDRHRYDVLDFPFLAVLPSGSGATLTAVPFVCVEGFSGPGLTFRKSDTDNETKRKVAAAFWSILLRDLDTIAPFEEWVYDDESGVQKVGCGRGFLFVSDLEDWEDGGLRYDHHLSPFPGELFCCPDCWGSGVEDLFPFTEDCVTCNGTGLVTW
jgi:hypothetical protein